MKRALRSMLIRAAAGYHRARAARQPVSPREALRPRSILLIRPDHLGDLLFLTPALRALRVAQPEAEITVLAGPWSAAILAGNPDVDRVERLAFPGFERKPKKSPVAPYRALYAAATDLRGRFDVALICRFDHWWGAWLAAAADVPRIVGYDTADVAPFLTEVVHYQPGRHEVIQNFGLTATLGTPLAATPERYPLRYPVGEEERASARSLLEGAMEGSGEGPLVAIHPGSGALVKRWSVERWGELMRRLYASHGARFLITGGPSEVALAGAVAQRGAPHACSVAGRTTLPELSALFEACSLVIGPDSGPLHLAVAGGRPTIHLYGPVDPRTFGPWGDPAYNVVLHRSLACQFCNRLNWSRGELAGHPCTSTLPVGWVHAAASDLLDRGKALPPRERGVE